MRFSGKVAIVTGGGRGIGRATSELLARDGARVLIADISQDAEQVSNTMNELGLMTAFTTIDVSKEDQVARMVDLAVSHWGRLDVMVANAGMGSHGTIDQTETADLERLISVNLTSVFLCAKYAIRAMKASGGGSIVSTASICGLVGAQGGVAYGTTKGAVVNMTRSLALDCAADDIRVNSVCPGFLNIGTGGKLRDEKERDLFIAMHPLGRLGDAEEIAKAIAFLASDDASFITGVNLPVDGGYTAR